MVEMLDSAERFLLYIKRTSCTDFDESAIGVLDKMCGESAIRSKGSKKPEAALFFDGMRHGMKLLATILQQASEEDRIAHDQIQKTKDN